MKKLTALLLSLVLMVPALSWADPASPASVARECVRQMQLTSCVVRPDRTSMQPGEVLHIAGVRDVPMSVVADYGDLYNELIPTDTAMCDLALEKMTTEPGGDHDIVARAFWTPPDYEDMETYLAGEQQHITTTLRNTTALSFLICALMVCGAAVRLRRLLGRRSRPA